MNLYLETNNPSACCGCTACVKKCPTHCISMKSNKEGFLYPQLEDESACINCNACSSVCPMEKDNNFDYSSTYYAAYTRNKEIIMRSSSGGLFPILATHFLKTGGIVFGACFTADFHIDHISISSNLDLHKLLGSKYVQSDLGNTFEECKKLLNCGKKVLFTGTPCQISGLRFFLGKKYENLFTIDVICHGVPSQKMFLAYIDFLQNKHHAKLLDINFRDKKRNGWSITLKYVMKRPNGGTKTYYQISKLSEYFMAFLSGKISRESCYCCPFASMQRPGDITLGDFWGYQNTRPELRNDDGLSLLLVNNSNGHLLLDILKQNDVVMNDVSEESILASENKNLYQPTKRPEERNNIYKELDTSGFNSIADRYMRRTNTIKNRLINILPPKFLRNLRSIRNL